MWDTWVGSNDNWRDYSFCIGNYLLCSIESIENGGDNAIWKYIFGVFVMYSIGYPIVHTTAVIGLFSKSKQASVMSSCFKCW